MKRGLVTTIGAAGLGLFTGCMGNTSGDLAASKFGDLSNPLGAREDAYGEIDAACGLAPPDGSPSSLRRRPYLQQVQTRSAQLLWTSDASMTTPTVEVTLPGGQLVTTAIGAPDPSASPPESARQWVAALEGLQPDTLYCYDLDEPAQILRRGGFRTAPLAGSGRTVRLLAFGDTGDGSTDQQAVLEQMRTVPFDVAIHMGDLAYNVGARWRSRRNGGGVDFARRATSFSIRSIRGIPTADRFAMRPGAARSTTCAASRSMSLAMCWVSITPTNSASMSRPS
jgi:hypothetical protein